MPSKTGAAKAKNWKSNLGRDIEFILGEKEILPLLENGRLVSLYGQAGSVLYLHPNLAHASGLNLSPYMRTNLFLIYNDVNNKPDPNKANRPSFLATKEIQTLELINDQFINFDN